MVAKYYCFIQELLHVYSITMLKMWTGHCNVFAAIFAPLKMPDHQ